MTPRERWRAAFAHFGIDPSEPNALEKLTTCLALTLAKAGGESALPMLDVAFPSPGRWDGGKHSTLKNWHIDRAIDGLREGDLVLRNGRFVDVDAYDCDFVGPLQPSTKAAMRPRDAVKAVFDAMDTGAADWESLEKGYFGRRKELGPVRDRPLPSALSEATESAAIFAELWRALPVVTQHPDAPDEPAMLLGRIPKRVK